MVVAMYGIAKTGCIYVPINLDFPEERIQSMVDNVESKSVLVNCVDDKIFEKLVTCGIDASHIQSVNILTTISEDS